MRWELFYSLVFVIVLAACSTLQTPPPPEIELECQQKSYPCSFAEVSKDILERTNTLSDEVAGMLESGKSTSEAVTWLETQEGIAEVQSDAEAIRFRLEGGRAVWVVKEESLYPPDDPAPDASTLSSSAQNIVMPRVVAGQSTGEKSALVLAPFSWENATRPTLFLEPPRVAKILGETRGYEGNVTYKANLEEESTNVTVDDFSSFNTYDVVFVASHGTQLCSEGNTLCRTIIYAQIFQGSPLDLLVSKQQGVEWVKVNKTTSYLALSADYFRSNYPSGLSDALVFFSSCESANSDMAAALKGQTSVYLGWDGNVQGLLSAIAAEELFKSLSQGLTVEQAYDELGKYTTDSKGTQLTIGTRAEGGDMRIRDLVTLLNPATELALTETDKLVIQGQTGDGQADSVPYLVEVEGVSGEDINEMKVHIVIDGKEVEVRTPKDAENSGLRTFHFQGIAELGKDLGEGQRLELWAFVELPDGGMSEQILSFSVTSGEAPPPTPKIIWQGTATQTWRYTEGDGEGVIVTARAEVGLELNGSANQQHVGYTVAEGTMTWTIAGTGFLGCVYDALPVVVAIPASDADYLSFNTASTPNEVEGKGSTDGPDAEVTVSCPNQPSYTETVDTNSLWLNIPDSLHHQVVGDNFSGTYETSLHKYSWTFSKVNSD